MLGVAGYNYRQLTGDSGAGSLKGSVDAVGPALSYSTTVGATPLTIGARYFMEYNAEKRWDTNATFLSATMTFPRRRRRLQRRSRRNSMSVNTITAPGSVMVIAASALFILITTAALAEVDIRTRRMCMSDLAECTCMGHGDVWRFQRPIGNVCAGNGVITSLSTTKTVTVGSSLTL